jgi:hypothetical protein
LVLNLADLKDERLVDVKESQTVETTVVLMAVWKVA